MLGVGSLFESFDLLERGFRNAFQQHSSALPIKKVEFFRPTISPAVGSAILAAKQVGVQIEIERLPRKILTLYI